MKILLLFNFSSFCYEKPDMFKLVLLSTPLLVILFSCKKENDPGKIFALETLQSNTLEIYADGEEKFAMIKEMTEDKTYPKDFRSKIQKFHGHFNEIDSIIGIYISKIEEMKINMFNSFGEELSIKKEASILHYDFKLEKKSRPYCFEYSNVKYTGSGDILNSKNKETLAKSFKDLRRKICQIIEQSNNVLWNNEHYYFFKDPSINHFENQKDFLQKFEKALQNSNVALDDKEAIAKIYYLLSKTDKQWESILDEHDDWKDDINIIISLENNILQARAMAFSLMRYKIGCCEEYGFTSILPFVYGPSIALAGDTIHLNILMAAYNENKQPEIQLFSVGQILKIEKGIGHLEVIIPKSKEIELKGNITIRNNSGIPKTQNWSHKVKVLSRDK